MEEADEAALPPPHWIPAPCRSSPPRRRPSRSPSPTRTPGLPRDASCSTTHQRGEGPICPPSSAAAQRRASSPPGERHSNTHWIPAPCRSSPPRRGSRSPSPRKLSPTGGDPEGTAGKEGSSSPSLANSQEFPSASRPRTPLRLEEARRAAAVERDHRKQLDAIQRRKQETDRIRQELQAEQSRASSQHKKRVEQIRSGRPHGQTAPSAPSTNAGVISASSEMSKGPLYPSFTSSDSTAIEHNRRISPPRPSHRSPVTSVGVPHLLTGEWAEVWEREGDEEVVGMLFMWQDGAVLGGSHSAAEGAGPQGPCPIKGTMQDDNVSWDFTEWGTIFEGRVSPTGNTIKGRCTRLPALRRKEDSDTWEVTFRRTTTKTTPTTTPLSSAKPVERHPSPLTTEQPTPTPGKKRSGSMGKMSGVKSKYLNYREKKVAPTDDTGDTAPQPRARHPSPTTTVRHSTPHRAASPSQHKRVTGRPQGSSPIPTERRAGRLGAAPATSSPALNQRGRVPGSSPAPAVRGRSNGVSPAPPQRGRTTGSSPAPPKRGTSTNSPGPPERKPVVYAPILAKDIEARTAGMDKGTGAAAPAAQRTSTPTRRVSSSPATSAVSRLSVSGKRVAVQSLLDEGEVLQLQALRAGAQARRLSQNKKMQCDQALKQLRMLAAVVQSVEDEAARNTAAQLRSEHEVAMEQAVAASLVDASVVRALLPIKQVHGQLTDLVSSSKAVVKLHRVVVDDKKFRTAMVSGAVALSNIEEMIKSQNADFGSVGDLNTLITSTVEEVRKMRRFLETGLLLHVTSLACEVKQRGDLLDLLMPGTADPPPRALTPM